ncbi:MAG: hypothetical protein ABI540_02445 [Spartobacteria bacterium]
MAKKFRQLRLRAFDQAALFTAFNIFWTAAPLILLRKFHFTQNGVALFALAGAGGALAAPVAGALADRGMTRLATLAAHLVLVACFLGADAAVAVGSLVAFFFSALLIDSAVQLNHVTSQKIILAFRRRRAAG